MELEKKNKKNKKEQKNAVKDAEQKKEQYEKKGNTLQSTQSFLMYNRRNVQFLESL